jgi:hypothetical protein
MTSKITDFVARKDQEAKRLGVPDHRKNRVEQWLGALNQLFRQIEIWLAESVVSGAASISRLKTFVHEEAYGSYETDKLLISIAGSTISVEPMGAFVLGANGRVDLRGSNGQQVVLILLADGWHFTGLRSSVDKMPRMLDEDGFLSVLQQLLDRSALD